MAARTLERGIVRPPEDPRLDDLHAAAKLFAKSAMLLGALMCLFGAVLLILRSLA
jgi:hypothetical protein